MDFVICHHCLELVTPDEDRCPACGNVIHPAARGITVAQFGNEQARLRAQSRYPKLTRETAALRRAWVDSPDSVSPIARTIDGSELAIISRFLEDARDAGIVDEATLQRLATLAVNQHLAAPPAPSEESTEPSVAPPPPAAEPEPPPISEFPRSFQHATSRFTRPPITPPSAARVTTPESDLPSSVEAETPPAPPAPPPEPGPFATWLSGVWDAVAADVALHGLSYLGVLVTVVGVIGFLFFAFGDLPDASQPFVELFIASVFFGWSWALRRQSAVRVGQGMELIGGIVLPLVLFAGLADGAPFPPDFKEGPLVAALATTALLLALGYTWYTARRPGSVLRFLVGPLVWLAAMCLGFVFKTDEPLTSTAITRLVSQQPALAAAAIALTLLAVRRRPSYRLVQPTVSATLVALPVTYLLTTALSAGEGWEHMAPLIVLGIATFVSVEMVLRWYARDEWFSLSRPILLAGVLLPLAPTWDVGWVGLLVVVGYLVLAEPVLRSGSVDGLGLGLAAAGVVAGAVMTVVEPWAALVGFSLLMGWAPFQRGRVERPLVVDRGLLVVGALAPVGVAWALVELIGGGVGWVIISLLVTAVGGWAKWQRRTGLLWALWPSNAAVAVAVGSIVVWIDTGMNDLFPCATLAAAAATIAIGPRFLPSRVWFSALMLITATVVGMVVLDTVPSTQSVTWAALGLMVIVASLVRKSSVAGHIAAVGHVVALASLFQVVPGAQRAIVLALWSTGWVISTIAVELGRESLTSLLDRTVALIGRHERPATVAAWLPPVVVAASVPPTLLSSLNLWSDFRNNRSWTGVAMAAIALLYASGVRVAGRRRHLSVVMATGAMVSSMIGVAVSAPDPWSSILAASALIGVAILLTGDVRSSGFEWLAWVMTFVLGLLVANRAGVEADSLHLISLGWGALLLLGGLALDDRRSGRRLPGQGLRTEWLRQPVMLGALVVPVSLGPVFLRDPDVYGWWSVGAAAGYLLVAWLLRVGAVSSVSYVLASLAAVSLSPWSLLDQPWRLVFIAAPLVVVSWISERRRPGIVDPWLRWDIGPLVVAHAVGVFALVYGAANGGIRETALAFGLLSLALAGWRRNWWWADAANALLLLAAVDVGGVWPAIALAITTARGAVFASFTTGVRRIANHAVGAASAGLSWLALLEWLDLDPATAVGASAVFWGTFTAAVAAVGRFRRPRTDALWLWGGAGGLAMLVVSQAVAQAGTEVVDGPWLGLGYLMVAVAIETARPLLKEPFRVASIPLAAASWVTILIGVDLSNEAMVDLTTVVFGGLMAGVAEFRRVMGRMGVDGSESVWMARGWLGLGGTGVVLASAVAAVFDIGSWWTALGFALVAVGSARGAEPLSLPWLRDVSGIALLAALLFAAAAGGWSGFGQATVLVVSGALAAAAVLLVRNRPGADVWVRPLAFFGGAASLIAGGYAVEAWPDRSLAVALMLSLGIQAWALGVAFGRVGIAALGPVLIGAGFLLVVEQSTSGSAQWYTVPLGLVVLAEVEILRYSRLSGGQPGSDVKVFASEGAGLGLIVVPALVEMFITNLGFGFVALGAAVMCLVWAILTRVKRRVVAAGVIATSAAVLMLAAAAAGGAPASAFWWIVAIAMGFTVMLVAALIEAYRSRKGRVMVRLDKLMEDWQ